MGQSRTDEIRVLHVEDEPDFAELAAAYLERVDDRFSVETAASASEGLDRVAERDVDCIVSDFDMPGTDGIEFLEAVREDDPDIPVLLFTGNGSEEVAGEAIRKGATDYLQKETGTDQYTVLANRIRNAVEQYRARQHTDELDRTELEAELEEKSSQLDAIFEELPVSLYFKDDEARHVRVSRGHATGYEGYYPPRGKGDLTIEGPGDFLGETDLDLFPEQNATASHEDDCRVIETGEPILRKEEHLTYDDGSERWLTTTKIPWRGADEHVEGLLGFSLDITERKRYERRLERQNERLKEFASIVSHDLRNPLNVASGRLELLRDEYDSEHLDAIERAHGRMEGLIEDLLVLARQGKTVEDEKRVRLATIVDRSWESVETAGATPIVETERAIRADPDRLQQLLDNLFRNAVEHDGSDVTVTVGDLDGGFYVADDGPGIPEAERERVFERGYTTGGDGTGFGLAIVERIADAHGWEISVTESATGGARFEFTGVEFVDS